MPARVCSAVNCSFAQLQPLAAWCVRHRAQCASNAASELSLVDLCCSSEWSFAQFRTPEARTYATYEVPYESPNGIYTEAGDADGSYAYAEAGPASVKVAMHASVNGEYAEASPGFMPGAKRLLGSDYSSYETCAAPMNDVHLSNQSDL